MDIKCGGFIFTHNFDSGNLAKVELVDRSKENSKSAKDDDDIDFEFNVWTRRDCAGTEFENGNRTWFYFGIKDGTPFTHIKINVVNLNRQGKMYSQGMAPVYRVCPGRAKWERVKDRPTFGVEDHEFCMSFKFHLQDTYRSTVYFAFTYPFSYTELQAYLTSCEMINRIKINYRLYTRLDDIYYHRECVCYSLENRRVDLITISSYHNLTQIREPRLANLFPDQTQPRPFKFIDKKVIFLSARVHPGETPSSFVLNGAMSVLVSRDDPVGQILRRHFVFKIMPMLNPDGVVTGNYRTDTRGVNLNRVYLNPSLTLHPTVYAARSVIRYHHHGMEVPENFEENTPSDVRTDSLEDEVSGMSIKSGSGTTTEVISNKSSPESSNPEKLKAENITSIIGVGPVSTTSKDSGLMLYVDMHGHASKKGVFMYGNHFDAVDDKVECMLFPKLISLNSQHFDFEACNFSEKNMYVKDKRDGMSREGSGRVAIYKATGLRRCYTLECNYNTGKHLNHLPPLPREHKEKSSGHHYLVPPKYTPTIYEEVGRSLLISVLDLCGLNPNSRLSGSQYRSLNGVREWLRHRNQSEQTLSMHKQRFAASQVKGNKSDTTSAVRDKGEKEDKGRLPYSAAAAAAAAILVTTTKRHDSSSTKRAKVDLSPGAPRLEKKRKGSQRRKKLSQRRQSSIR